MGCTPRPHRPKEIMISVRAEGGPPVLVGNTEVCGDIQTTVFNVIHMCFLGSVVELPRGRAAGRSVCFSVKFEQLDLACGNAVKHDASSHFFPCSQNTQTMHANIFLCWQQRDAASSVSMSFFVEKFRPPSLSGSV